MFTFGKEAPFEDIDHLQLALHLWKGNRLDKPSNCLPSVYAIMKECWAFENKNRPDFRAVLERLTQLQPHVL